MTLKTYLRLATRLLAREWRAGELRVLFWSLVIAVAATSGTGFFSERLNRGMLSQSSELLGADLVLEGPQSASGDVLAQASALGLKSVQTISFPSVLYSGEQLQLVAMRGVSDGYPLRGELRVSEVPWGEDASIREMPRPGEVWLDPRAYASLAIKPGDTVEFGSIKLRAARVLTYGPGRLGGFFGMAPRALIHIEDIETSGVLAKGSRATYQLMVSGREAVVDEFYSWMQKHVQPNERLLNVKEGRPAIGSALDRAERYLGMTIIVAVILAGVAIGVAARRYSERHYDVSALLRCFGGTQNSILALYFPQLLVLGLVASIVGVIAGWGLQLALVQLLSDLFPAALPHAGWQPVWLGVLSGLLVLAGFAVPPFLRLREVPTLRVLRRELSPYPASAWLVAGMALAVILLLLWQYTKSLPMAVAFVSGLVVVFLSLALGVAVLLAILKKSIHRRASFWLFGVRNLFRVTRNSLGQAVAFSFAIMAMAIIAFVRTDLIETWLSQLPEDTPNYFAVNILPQEVNDVHSFLRKKGIENAGLYPLVRGRLIRINNDAVRKAVTKEDVQDNAVHRELNLTWSSKLQSDNKLLAGQWWSENMKDKNLVSVESKLAERLNIRTGDRLTFFIAGKELEATVASLREVKWDSFQPNFYMVFHPGVLDTFPATYMTSFYVTSEQKSVLINLVKKFPSVTLLAIDQIINQVRTILRQVTLAVELLMVLVFVAGIAVLYAAVLATLGDRLFEGAILRTLGASRWQLNQGHLVEYVLLGMLAGVVSAVGAEAVIYVLYDRVLHLPFTIRSYSWWLNPLAGGLIIGLIGFIATRPARESRPMTVLRRL